MRTRSEKFGDTDPFQREEEIKTSLERVVRGLVVETYTFQFKSSFWRVLPSSVGILGTLFENSSPHISSVFPD